MKDKLILVIDDSITVRKIIEVCLRRAGCNVKGFGDGIEALRWLVSAEGHAPDLVLLDINLPKMDGYEVARRLKSQCQTTIIMISRRSGMVDRFKARMAGVDGYLTKPLTTQTLLAVAAC